MELTGQNIIGQRCANGQGAPFQSVNPATNALLSPSYTTITDTDFDEAMQLAQTAFRRYRQIDNETRATFLTCIAEEIDALGEVLINRAIAETGLTYARLVGERNRTCAQLRLFAQVLRDGGYQDIRVDSALPKRTPLPRSDLRSLKLALGPVAVFGASNFPLAFSVAGGDTASALAAGCPVVVKGHNAHLGTSELVGKAVQKAVKKSHMPEGVFSLIFGADNTLGEKLVTHPVIQAVGFTGSRKGGLALLRLAQSRPVPIPVYAEMSSINPVYILPQALKQRGADLGKALVASMAMGSGQFCTSPGLVFAVADSGYDDFILAAQMAIQEQAAQVMLTPSIAAAFAQDVIQMAAQTDVTTLAIGPASTEPNRCQAHLFEVNATAFARDPLLQKEIFGSSAVVVRCDNTAQMLALSESLEGQLTAAIHIGTEEDDQFIEELVAVLELKAGRLLFNGFGTGVEVCDAMVHGGPWPSTSDGRTTSVGTAAIDRFLRPVCYQDFPKHLLPEVLMA